MTGPDQTMRIGITDCAKYENYRKWIAEAGHTAVRLTKDGDLNEQLPLLDGVLFSGGEDVHPALYAMPEYEKAYRLSDFNGPRDDFEYRLIEQWLLTCKPVLGICRGMQLINVFHGGSMLPDIPSVTGLRSHGKIEGVDSRHSIAVVPESLLARITGKTAGEVNSAHHQSVANPATAFRITAIVDQQIVEAMEWADPVGKPWLLLLQWHPERMTDMENPFSKNIREAFLRECAKK